MKMDYHHGNLTMDAISKGTELALEKGLENLSLREIAAKCGVVPSSIYKHFEDREQMIAAISGAARKELAASMLDSIQQLEDSKPESRMRAAGRSYINFAQSQPGHFQIAFKRQDFEADEANDGSPWGILNRLSSDMKAHHSLSEGTSNLQKIFAWSAVHGLAELIASGALPREVDVEKVIEQTLENILDSYRNIK